VIATIFVFISIFDEGSGNKKQAAFIMSILREVLLVLLCIFSFLLLSKMKGDIDYSSARLD
jgi:uncharacterized membrane protein